MIIARRIAADPPGEKGFNGLEFRIISFCNIEEETSYADH
jgi:hypothetical protein